jgi:transposase
MAENRTIIMSTEEIKRSEILRMADERLITQKIGAKRIGVTERHFRRLLQRYREGGPEGIVSKQRGKPSHNRIPERKKEKILNKLREDYQGFGPTLASEKLLERDGIRISKETVRQIMIDIGLHQPKTRKKDRIHPLRERRMRRGELVQMDGSYHAWLEDRAEKACLLLFVDDATSEILAAEFVEHESYEAYSALCKRYFRQHGLPEAFYTDRFSVFRVNQTNITTTEAQTQFERAMAELGIELICASSPQAKGRVERANQTLQDRLVKEMRLAGIKDYESGNAFLADYLPVYNSKFAVLPASPIDSHEPLRLENDLDLIFTKRVVRKLSKDLQFQYDRVIYQIESDRPAYALQGREVTVCVGENGKLTVLLNQTPLNFTQYIRQPKRNPLATSKDIERKSVKPAPDHPWRRYGLKVNDNPAQVPN